MIKKARLYLIKEIQAASFTLYRHPTQFRVVLLVLLVILLSVPLIYVWKTNCDRGLQSSSTVTENTASALKEIRDKNAIVMITYEKCEDLYSKGTFIFFQELKACRDDVADKLKTLQNTRDKYAPTIDSDSLNLTDTFITSELENYRQLSVNAYMTNSFEENFIRAFWEGACFRQRSKENKEINESMRKEVERSVNEISNLMNDQTIQYYRIRDFVIPGLYNIQNILDSRARNVIGLDSEAGHLPHLKNIIYLSRNKTNTALRKTSIHFKMGL